MTESSFRSFLHRSRVRFRGLIRREVSPTVTDPESAESEVDDLFSALAT